MAYPTGSGSEVLKRTYINALADAQTAFRWDGTPATLGTTTYTVPALHIITVLGVYFCDQSDGPDSISMMITAQEAGNNIYLFQSQPIAGKATFVWNDKFVLMGGDKLVVFSTSGANQDVSCHYIDQDWS